MAVSKENKVRQKGKSYFADNRTSIHISLVSNNRIRWDRIGPPPPATYCAPRVRPEEPQLYPVVPPTPGRRAKAAELLSCVGAAADLPLRYATRSTKSVGVRIT